LNILRAIATKIRGQNCEKMVKRIGNEVSFSLPSLAPTEAKINIGTFSNKIVELQNASNIASALDNSQYLICKFKASTTDILLKKNCEKIYLQILLALTQLETIFEAIKIDPTPEARKQLVDWIKFCSSLNKHAIGAVSPGTQSKGPEDLAMKDIMTYQNITEQDLDEALKEIE